MTFYYYNNYYCYCYYFVLSFARIEYIAINEAFDVFHFAVLLTFLSIFIFTTLRLRMQPAIRNLKLR